MAHTDVCQIAAATFLNSCIHMAVLRCGCIITVFNFENIAPTHGAGSGAWSRVIYWFRQVSEDICGQMRKIVAASRASRVCKVGLMMILSNAQCRSVCIDNITLAR